MKKHFSLLEVLIAFLLISLSLPLLMAPFMYASVDQKEMVDKMRAETASQYAITSFLTDLQLGTITQSQIVDKSEFPLREEWFRDMGGNVKGSYTLKKLKPLYQQIKDDDETEIELWEVGFTFTSVSLKKLPYFPFKFTIVREK